MSMMRRLLRLCLPRLAARLDLRDMARGKSGIAWATQAGLWLVPDFQPQKAPFSPGVFGRCRTPPPDISLGPYEWRKAEPLSGLTFQLIGIDWSADYAAELAARAGQVAELDRWADDGGLTR